MQINSAVQSAGRVLTGGVRSLNAVAERNIVPSLNLKSNVNAKTLNAVKNAAKNVAATKKNNMKLVGGSRRVRKTLRGLLSFF
jgi:hypothetical protein